MTQPRAGSASATRGSTSTPRRLSQLSALAIALCLILGGVGVVTFLNIAGALDRASDNTEQLIRVQSIQTSLLEADATATNSFLVGGLESTEQRATYDQAIEEATRLIAKAADAQSADAEALAVLNDNVVEYAATIEQARANNRQGFPVGAQYLRTAGAELRDRSLPIVDNLVEANADRAKAEMHPSGQVWFTIVGIVAFVSLLLIMLWVARRFKRTLNLGLIAATALILITLIVGSIALASVRERVDDIAAGPFNDVRLSARARIEANNAKSNESLTLIARGSGASFEQAWAGSAQRVVHRLDGLSDDTSLDELWQTYAQTHTEIRKLADGGNWDGAVGQATGHDSASSNVTFGDFDRAVKDYLDRNSDHASADLHQPVTALRLGALLTTLAAAAAAVLSRLGLAARIKEYL